MRPPLGLATRPESKGRHDATLEFRFEDYVDCLQGAGGSSFQVQKIWSAVDGKPVAFAANDGGFGSFQ